MLYGRCEERALISDLLRGAREGRSGVLVLRGEAGVGKHTLLEDAARQASDFHLLRATGIESEVGLPFAGLHQLLRPVLDRVDRLPLPQAAALRGAFGLLDTEAGSSQFLVELAVLGLLAELARERPVLCLVRDAQWLDQASADALVFIARRLERDPTTTCASSTPTTYPSCTSADWMPPQPASCWRRGPARSPRRSATG
jgi:predicted ATPase